MKKIKFSRILLYVSLSIASLISVFPFIWMIIGATNTSKDIIVGKATFGGELINNFSSLLSSIDLPLVLWNSSKIAFFSTLFGLLISSLAGYGFEMYRSKSREKVYSILLLAMMVPFAAIMIPLYRMFGKLKLTNTHLAVVLPTVAVVFLVFFFRQNTKSFSKELAQAARVDGLNEIQIFFYIYLPTMKSTYAAAAIIAFMTSWNNYLWPLIVLQSDNKKTIILALSSMASAYTPDYGAIMLAIIIATLPTLLIFFLMQKRFVEGMIGSIK